MDTEETVKMDAISSNSKEELHAFEAVSLILRLLGLECPSTRPGWRRWVSCIRRLPAYAFITQGLLYVVALLGKVRMYESLDMNMSLAVSVSIWMAACTMSTAYLLRWDATEVKRRLALLITKATGQAGAKARKRVMNIRVAVHLSAFALLVTASTFFQFATVVQPPLLQPLGIRKTLYGTLTGSRYFDYLTIALVGYAAACWCLVTTFVTISFASVYEEFQVFNEKLREHDAWNLESMRHFTATYFRLCKVVEHMNTAFATFIFISLSSDIANFVLQVYSLVTGCCGQAVFGYAFLGMTAFFIFLRFLAFSLSPAKVHESALASACIIAEALDCDAVAADAELYRSASWFVQKVSSHPVGITLGGFCIITKPLLLTVGSVVVTYLILLIQMAPNNGFIIQNGTLGESSTMSFVA